MQKPEFVELETQEGLANPEFVQLHCVRAGEVRWGLDVHGCLSLYVPSVVESKLVERVYYVARDEGDEDVEGQGKMEAEEGV